MTLRPDQRAELEALGPDNVRIRLIGAGTNIGACVGGFKTGDMDRGDVEDWLAEKYAGQVRVESWTLWAAVVGAVAGTIGVLIALLK